MALVILPLCFRHPLISLMGLKKEKPRRYWLEMNPDRDKWEHLFAGKGL